MDPEMNRLSPDLKSIGAEIGNLGWLDDKALETKRPEVIKAAVKKLMAIRMQLRGNADG